MLKVNDVVRVTANHTCMLNAKVGDILRIFSSDEDGSELGPSITLGTLDGNVRILSTSTRTAWLEVVKRVKTRGHHSGNSNGVRFPLTVKLQAVGLRKTGMTINNIAIQCKASRGTIHYWLRQHKLGQFNEPIAFQRTCTIIRA